MSDTPGKAFPSPSEKVWLSAVVGLSYWAVVAVAVVLLVPVIQSQQTGTEEYSTLGIVLIIVLVCAGFLGFHFAVRGCDLGSQYSFGTFGHFLKFFALILVMMTVIGAVPVLFWSGRGLLRMFHGEIQIIT